MPPTSSAAIAALSKQVLLLEQKLVSERAGHQKTVTQLNDILRRTQRPNNNNINNINDNNNNNNPADESTESTESTDLITAPIVGTVESCFPRRFGTPRQGVLAPATRGAVQLNTSVIGRQSLIGLEGFSHAWLLFVFNHNTDSHKSGYKRPMKDGKFERSSFKELVTPPQAGGSKIGVFATRTPHRPWPVGLSLVSIKSIEKETARVNVGGLDLLHGTPIVDIKPYVPYADMPATEYFCPDWVSEKPTSNTLPASVTFGEPALLNLKELVDGSYLRWYGPGETAECRLALEQSLVQDPRSLRDGRGKFSEDAYSKTFHLCFDTLNVDFLAFMDRDSGKPVIHIHTIELTPLHPLHRKRASDSVSNY